MPFAHFQIVWFLLLSFESCLYILNTSSLQAMWFANICSHSVACLFILLAGSFRMKGFNFDEVKFFIFFLLWIVLLVSSLKTLCQSSPRSQNFLCFYSKIFTVLHCTFKTLIYFYLIFI